LAANNFHDESIPYSVKARHYIIFSLMSAEVGKRCELMRISDIRNEM